MTCPPPPPCPPPCPPPPPPPPPGGGDRCERLFFECVCPAAIDTWSLVLQDCVDNANCDGSFTCTETTFSAEIINGCNGNVPLVDPNTFDPADPLGYNCQPKCCDTVTLGCCLRIEYACICPGGGGSWWDFQSVKCVDNGSSECSGATGPGDPNSYIRVQQNACVCGETNRATLLDDATNAGMLPITETADCCYPGGRQCRVDWIATCTNSLWLVTWNSANCVQNCEPTDWVAQPGNECSQTRSTCLGVACDADQTCIDEANNILPGDYPAAPAGLPACCTITEQNCSTVWRATCEDFTWTVAELGSLCVAGCAQTDWAGDDPCVQERVTCGDVCAPVNGACTPPGDAAPGQPVGTPSCCELYCNCTYISGWDCDTSSWSEPTLVGGTCTESGTNDASPWAYDGTCDALITVSATGRCV